MLHVVKSYRFLFTAFCSPLFVLFCHDMMSVVCFHSCSSGYDMDDTFQWCSVVMGDTPAAFFMTGCSI
ncbi:MAG: hypothetical protein C4522_01715 [Desulfobacteraceae bacterium]|nr:MAG: hypothetical protein C4522_01715 [Desulfobacteraceae bacterium]